MHFKILLIHLLSYLSVCAGISTHLPGKWASLSNITIFSRQEHTTVALDSSIYILGGVIPDENGEIAPTVNITQRYSITSHNWSLAASLPIPLNHINAAVISSKIYVLGGLTPQNGIWNVSQACFVYEPTLDEWSYLGEMPEGRQIGAAAVAVDGSTIYLAGGLKLTNLTDDEEDTVDIVTSYDVTSGIWTTHPNMPAPRDHAGVGLIGRTLYVLGGRAFGHDNVVDTVFAYDLDAKMWSSELASMPTARGGVASAVVGKMIFTMGGEGNPANGSGGVFPQNQAYDTTEDRWIEFAPMDVPRHGTSAVAIDGRVYIPGGGLMEGGDPTDFFSYFEVR